MKIRVLVADDSSVMRHVVKRMLESDADLEVVGMAPNGAVALKMVSEVEPDILISDIDMPEMGGLDLTSAIHKLRPQLPIIIFSALTERGASVTIEALARGATDYETKPSGLTGVDGALDAVRDRLISKIKALCRRVLARSSGLPTARPVAPILAPRAGRVLHKVDVVGIGVSTGGPDALKRVFTDLPASFPVPIVIVQHMPPMFTKSLAQSLDKSSQLCVVEASEGDVLEAGKALVAPGGYHMTVVRDKTRVRVALNQDPLEHSCRPAVDVLFRSIATTYHDRGLGVVLTGMGRDGMEGARQISGAGGQVLAQDEATSVVWGMPGVVANSGIADAVVPLESVAEEMSMRCSWSGISRAAFKTREVGVRSHESK